MKPSLHFIFSSSPLRFAFLVFWWNTPAVHSPSLSYRLLLFHPQSKKESIRWWKGEAAVAQKQVIGEIGEIRHIRILCFDLRLWGQPRHEMAAPSTQGMAQAVSPTETDPSP